MSRSLPLRRTYRSTSFMVPTQCSLRIQKIGEGCTSLLMLHAQSRLRGLRSLILWVASPVVLAAPGGVPADIEALNSKVELLGSQQATSQAQLTSLVATVNRLTSASNSLQTPSRR